MQLVFLIRRKLATKSWGTLLSRKRCPLNFTLYVTRYCGWSSLFQKEKLSASAKNIHSTPFSFAFCGWTLVLTNRSLRESLAELNRSARASAHFSIPSLSSLTCRAWSGTQNKTRFSFNVHFHIQLLNFNRQQHVLFDIFGIPTVPIRQACFF